MGIMNLFSSKPKIKVQTAKKDGFSGWLKCTYCHELIHGSELKKNLHCCPKCEYHYKMSAEERISLIADPGSFYELFENYTPVDAFGFVDTQSYADRLKKAQAKTGQKDAAIVGLCTIGGIPSALGVLDFGFMGGSMGSVVGEKICALIEYATDKALALVLVSASGGARMQESILSLMQMAKTSGALARYRSVKKPYISILTHPTTGGVTASFATLGDIILAEPQALIGFAGPRVVQQITREQLPKEAQTAEFLLKKGMIDAIVSRHELKKKLAFFLQFFQHSESFQWQMEGSADHASLDTWSLGGQAPSDSSDRYKQEETKLVSLGGGVRLS